MKYRVTMRMSSTFVDHIRLYWPLDLLPVVRVRRLKRLRELTWDCGSEEEVNNIRTRLALISQDTDFQVERIKESLD